MSDTRTKKKRFSKSREPDQRLYIPKPAKAWAKRDETADKFYVYVLKLHNGDYYIGQTREIRERLMEHRDGQTRSVRDREPKLQYFEIVASRETAMCREMELKGIARNNRREMVRIIRRFHDVVRELEYN
jgi:predicted GIY-YIG superfamily endonuclease